MPLSLEDVIAKIESVTGHTRKKQGQYFMLCCPGHDDNPGKRSLSVKAGDKGGVLLKCHANCEKEHILKALGLEWKDIMPPQESNGALPKTYEQDGFTFPGAWSGARVIQAYIYRDALGKERYAVLRTNPKGEFPQGRFEGNKWRPGLGGEPALLFDLPELIRGVSKGLPVYLVEGEKDVRAIQKAGGISTCNSGGAGKWRDEFCHHLKGATIILVRDKDGAGKDHVRRVAASLRRAGIDYRIVESAHGKDAYDHLEAGYNLDEFIDVEEDPYRFLGGKTFRATKDTEKKIKWTCLANFQAKITHEMHIDNGLRTETIFKMEGLTENSASPKLFEIKASEFPSLSWAIPNLGAKAIVSPGQTTRDYLRVAIQTLSDPTQHNIYAQSGWRMIGDEWHFITNSGGITRHGLNKHIEVDLGRVGLSPLSIEPKEGYAVALDRLAASVNSSVWAPLIGTVFLAPLRPFIEPDYALMICGESGKFKSEIAAIAQSFFGPFRRTNLPANFDSTENYVELVLHSGKDCAIVVDDFYPANDRMKASKLAAVLDRILRGIGNSSARGRLNSDSQARAGYTPKSIPILTAEKLPVGQSNSSRAYILELEGDIVTAADLTDLQRMAADGLYAGAMYDYLSWIAGNWERLASEVPSKFEKIRASLATTGHRRAAANSAWILLGIWAYCQWMESAGHIADANKVQEIAERTMLAVKGVAELSAERVEQQSAPQHFLSTVTEGLLAGKIHLQNKNGKSPEMAESFGWNYGSNGLEPHGELIGYVEKDEVWLLPGVAYGYVSMALARQQISFSLDANSLWRQLKERGITIHSQSSPTPTQTVSVQGKSLRVIRLPRALFVDAPGQGTLETVS